MGWIRACFRVPLIFFLLAGLIVINRTAWIFSSKNSSRRYQSNKRGTRFIARCIARVIGMRIRVVGSPPEEPYILVSNHLGYMDIVALCTVDASVFIAKSDVSSWPFIGPMVRSTNIAFVDRVNHRDLQRVNRIAEECVRLGRGIIFYPEGTSSPGDRILPFRPSLLEYAAQANFPVHCSTLQYKTPPGCPPAGDIVAWWGDQDFFSHLFRLAHIPSFEATLTFAAEPVRAGNRKVLATRLYDTCMGIFAPTETHFPTGATAPAPPTAPEAHPPG